MFCFITTEMFKNKTCQHKMLLIFFYEVDQTPLSPPVAECDPRRAEDQEHSVLGNTEGPLLTLQSPQ